MITAVPFLFLGDEMFSGFNRAKRSVYSTFGMHYGDPSGDVSQDGHLIWLMNQ